jgi:hypothetical protein
MFSEKWVSEKQFRLISIFLFSFLFVYLILRALYVDYLHDEAATYLHYIETGFFWGKKSIIDANNHLLNSFVGHLLYKVFGENQFLFRLPNLLSFPIYFWAIYQLISTFRNALFRLFVLLGLTCIPFILEYFANCRGYGISLAFFMAFLVFLTQLSKNATLKNHILAAACLIIAVYANLTFLVSALLAVLFILVQQIRQNRTLTKKQHLHHLLVHFLFGVCLIPAAIFARTLKIGGALYYGRLDGLWEVTGTTISKYTLFTDHIALKWLLIALGVLFISILVIRWIKNGFSAFFEEQSTVLAWFLFGHLAVIVVLATFLEVNYPEDRVGMYLIPLTLLLIATELNRRKSLQLMSIAFLFFPISFIPKMNLTRSVFSPDDRMTKIYYQKVENELSSDHTSIAIYHLMSLTWSLHNRNANQIRFPATSNTVNNAADIFLSRENLKLSANDLKQFDTLYVDHSNGFLAFKRKTPFRKSVVKDTLINTLKIYDEYINIIHFNIPDSLKNKSFQLHVKGLAIIDDPRLPLSLDYSVFNNKIENLYFNSWTTRWSNGIKNEQEILFNYPVENWTNEDDEVRIYLHNPMRSGVVLKNVKFELLKLE